MINRNYKWINLLLLIAIFVLHSCTSEENNITRDFSRLSGSYLGQDLPGDEPEIFAPGLISTEMYTRDVAITPDGSEIYFCVTALGYNLIFYTKEVDGVWTEPQPAPFISDFDRMYYEPHITSDGKRLLFLSNMQVNENEPVTQNIWAVDRQDDSWEEPYNLGVPVNSDGNEFYPSTTRDGTLYFTRKIKGEPVHNIYRSKFMNGAYLEPEKLPTQVNCGLDRYNAFVDPDERFIIVPARGMEDSFGGTDYYIVYRDKGDNWSEPVNLGPKVNTKSGREYSCSLSPDKKYFFFMSSRTQSIDLNQGTFPSYLELRERFSKPGNGNSSIYWMKSDFLMKLEK